MAVLKSDPAILRVHPDYRTGPGPEGRLYTPINHITVVFRPGTPGVEARALFGR